MLNNITNFLDTFNLPSNIVDEIESLFNTISVKKGENIVNEGEICDFLGFINDGYFRVFLKEGKNEITIHLGGTGNFLSSYSSFITREPSIETVQAVTDSTISLIKYQDLQSLYKKYPFLEKLGRVVMEKHFVEKEKRVISFIKDKAEDRYRHLLNNHQDFLLNIPSQYIASYLGMKPETFSRIKNKKVN